MASQITDSEPSSSKKRTNILSGKKVLSHQLNIGNMILNKFKSKPDFIGQIDAATGEQTTFQQMRENSVKCALWLKKSVDSCKSVAVCTCDQTLAYIPVLASLYIGATIHTWDNDDTHFTDLHCLPVAYFLLEHEPKVIFIDDKDYDMIVHTLDMLIEKKLISHSEIVTFEKHNYATSLESILNDSFDENEINQFSCKELEPTSIIATIFSSNATNQYKADLRYFALTCPANQTVPKMLLGDISLWYGSLTWNYSIILIVRCILFDVTVIKPAAFTDEDMFKTIEKYKVTWVFLDSSLCNQMFETDLHTYDISSLKRFIYGNLPIRNHICQSLIKYLPNVSIIQVYGISEACIMVSYEWITPNKQTVPFRGQLTKNVQIMIKDLNTKDVLGQNKPGEIWYRLMCKCCKPEICESINCYNYKAKEDKINMKLYEFFSKWRCSEHFGYLKDDKLFVLDEIAQIIQFIDKGFSIQHVLTKLVVAGVPDADYGNGNATKRSSGT